MADSLGMTEFVACVAKHGCELYRDFSWRRTRDPYAVLVSEVMLQQTQVARVERRFDEWLEDYPTLEALAAAPLAAVLESWQGLGYNRRAIALKRAAVQLVADSGGESPATLPSSESALRALPGIGAATAAGVRAFAFELPSVYLETNVRTVFLHEMFAARDDVPDREIVPLVAEAMEEATRQDISPRQWYYALLDCGAQLKRSVPNPSRRSAHHARQAPFEGSRRQKRAWLLRSVMAGPGTTTHGHAKGLAMFEQEAGRDTAPVDEVREILAELAGEGFVVRQRNRWYVSERECP